MRTREELLKKASLAVKNKNKKGLLEINKEAKQNGYFDLAFYILGLIERVNERNDHAIEFFQKALEINPEDLKVLNALGTAYYKCGRYEEAIQVFLDSLKHGGKKEVFLYNLGLAYKLSGKYREAISSLAQVIETDRDFLPGYVSVCETAFTLNKMDTCRNYADLAYDNFSDKEDKRADLAKLMDVVGMYHYSRGDYDSAISYSDKAISLLDTAVFHANRGSYLSSLRKFDEALAEYETALAMDDKLGLAYYNRAETLHAGGDMKGAIENLSKAVELDEHFFEMAKGEKKFRHLRISRVQTKEGLLKALSKKLHKMK